jgi:hypothetical protein
VLGEVPKYDYIDFSSYLLPLVFLVGFSASPQKQHSQG